MSDACIPDKTLSALLDQALAGDRARQVRRHLAGCEDCRRRLADLQQTDDMIRSLPSITPSAGFDAGFWEKVERLEARQARPAWIQVLLGGWRPVLVATTTAAIVLAAIVFYPRAAPGPTMEELFMVDNVEMLDELELIQQLEMFEHWDDIQSMEEQG